MRNSTIISKKRKLDCGCFDYAFSKNKCKQHATIDSTNKRIQKFELEQEPESLQNLISDLDSIFSLYIRIRDSDENGLCKCITCSHTGNYKTFDAGHYIHRSDLNTRWHPKNVFAQCKKCNQFKDGMSLKFAEVLEEIEKGITEYLYYISKQIWKPTKDELKELIIEYRFKLNEIKRKIK
jgi:hypothetical protein